MRSELTRLLLIGAMLVSLTTVGAGAVAAAPDGTAAASGGSLADADGTNCAGTVCEAGCAVAGVVGKATSLDPNCVDSSASTAGGTATVGADGTECVTCAPECAERTVAELVKDQEPYACPA